MKVSLKARDYLPFHREVTLKARGTEIVAIPVKSGEFWYDVEISSPDIRGFKQCLAGRIEAGIATISDPALARTIMRDPNAPEF